VSGIFGHLVSLLLELSEEKVWNL